MARRTTLHTLGLSNDSMYYNRRIPLFTHPGVDAITLANIGMPDIEMELAWPNEEVKNQMLVDNLDLLKEKQDKALALWHATNKLQPDTTISTLDGGNSRRRPSSKKGFSKHKAIRS